MAWTLGTTTISSNTPNLNSVQVRCPWTHLFNALTLSSPTSEFRAFFGKQQQTPRTTTALSHTPSRSAQPNQFFPHRLSGTSEQPTSFLPGLYERVFSVVCFRWGRAQLADRRTKSFVFRISLRKNAPNRNVSTTRTTAVPLLLCPVHLGCWNMAL